jgi:DNA invertase Pin-like site-specific DNA recombinase
MSERHSTTAIDGVCYYRMSTDHQETSIPQQEAWARAKCQVEGVRIEREFRDEGISGDKTAHRDSFHDMLEFCRQRQKEGRPIRVIVCFSASRFSRADSHETGHYLWEFRQAGTHRLLTAERWIDFDREEDRVIFNLQQDMTNHRYLKDLSGNITRGLKDLAEAGYWVTGAAPYAYDRLLLDKDDRPLQRVRLGERVVRDKAQHYTLIPSEDPVKVETVRWLYHQYAETEVSLHALASTLNARGVPGPGGPRQKGDGPPTWSTATVRNILTNEAYCGDRPWGRTTRGRYHRFVNKEVQPVVGTYRGPRIVPNEEYYLHRNTHEPLVDRATWEKVQKKINARKSDRRYPRTGGYPLTGLLYCGHCQAAMNGTYKTSTHKGVPYTYHRYVCGKSQRQPGACGRYSVREDKLLRCLVAKLQEVYLSPDRLEGLRAQLKARLEERRQKQPDQAERLRERIAELERQIVQGRRRALQVKDEVTFVEYNAQLGEWVGQKGRLESELAGLEQAQGEPHEDLERKVDEAVARLATLGEALAKADVKRLPELRAVLKQLVWRIDVYFDEDTERKAGSWYRLQKGVVKLRPVLEFAGCGKNAHVP